MSPNTLGLIHSALRTFVVWYLLYLLFNKVGATELMWFLYGVLIAVDCLFSVSLILMGMVKAAKERRG